RAVSLHQCLVSLSHCPPSQLWRSVVLNVRSLEWPRVYVPSATSGCASSVQICTSTTERQQLQQPSHGISRAPAVPQHHQNQACYI
ncbi:uncharacterized, partial [Tachysurus ichikawai]